MNNKNNVVDLVSQHKIIAILRQVPVEKVVFVGEALYAGGIRLIEVTFDQNDPDCLTKTPDMIARLCARFGDAVSVGAGTVLCREQVRAAVKAGASYVLAPDICPDVLDEAKTLGIAAIPGAVTPTEVQLAYQLGAAVVKLFPAGDMGVAYVKSLRGPLNHIPLLAVGGIDETNLLEYLGAGMVGAGVGSNIVSKALIEQNDFAGLTALAQKYTSLF